MLPRLLDVTEEDYEEGEMLNRGMHGRHGDLWKAKLAIAAGIVLMLMMLLLSFAWGSGCNGESALNFASPHPCSISLTGSATFPCNPCCWGSSMA